MVKVVRKTSWRVDYPSKKLRKTKILSFIAGRVVRAETLSVMSIKITSNNEIWLKKKDNRLVNLIRNNIKKSVVLGRRRTIKYKEKSN